MGKFSNSLIAEQTLKDDVYIWYILANGFKPVAGASVRTLLSTFGPLYTGSAIDEVKTYEPCTLDSWFHPRCNIAVPSSGAQVGLATSNSQWRKIDWPIKWRSSSFIQCDVSWRNTIANYVKSWGFRIWNDIFIVLIDYLHLNKIANIFHWVLSEGVSMLPFRNT